MLLLLLLLLLLPPPPPPPPPMMMMHWDDGAAQLPTKAEVDRPTSNLLIVLASAAAAVGAVRVAEIRIQSPFRGRTQFSCLRV
jgi:hypothetical protein